MCGIVFPALTSSLMQASWSKIGAPSAFAIESTFADSNKKIHSSSDTMDQDGYSLDHIREVGPDS